MSFTERDWDRLATLFTIPGGYPGYKPETVEAPNGDTRACPECRGQGGDGGNYMGRWEFPCPACSGSGRVPNVDAAGVCGCCGGTGGEP